MSQTTFTVSEVQTALAIVRMTEATILANCSDPKVVSLVYKAITVTEVRDNGEVDVESIRVVSG